MSTIKMKLPEGVTGFGAGGVELEVHKGGIVNVPDQYVAVAKDHGLTIVNADTPVAAAGKRSKAPTIKAGARIALVLVEGEAPVEGLVKAVEGSEALVTVDGEDYTADISLLTLVEA